MTAVDTIVPASCVRPVEPCNDTSSTDMSEPIAIAAVLVVAALIAVTVLVVRRRRTRR